MVHIPFDTRSVGYDADFYYNEGQKQYGGGGLINAPSEGGNNAESNNNIPPQFHYFRGSAPYQRGYGFGAVQRGAGIGDILRGLWRMLMPLARRAGSAIGREALSTGERILDKVAEGENVKKTVIGEGKRGVDTLLQKSGLPKQFGTGAAAAATTPLRRLTSIKGPHKRRRHHSAFSHQTLIGPVTTTSNNNKRKKRQRTDTFGFY